MGRTHIHFAQGERGVRSGKYIYAVITDPHVICAYCPIIALWQQNYDGLMLVWL